MNVDKLVNDTISLRFSLPIIEVALRQGQIWFETEDAIWHLWIDPSTRGAMIPQPLIELVERK